MAEKQWLTCSELAKETGLPEEFFRSAMHRAKGFHPLPCMKFGNKRLVRRARLSDVEAWLEEELALQAGE